MSYNGGPGTGTINAPAGPGDTPVHLGLTVTPIIVSPGNLSTIPAPITASRGGPVPIPYPYCVITNSSPYALIVNQGAVLTQIAAFTQDLVQVPVPDNTTPITVLAQAGAANIAPGSDATVYATWYPADPGGQYPAAIGAGAIPIGTNQIIDEGAGGFITMGSGNGKTIPPWVQCCAVVVSGSGSNNGVLCIASGGGGNLYVNNLMNLGQVFYIPMNADPGFTVTLIAQAGVTITLATMYGLTGPVVAPSLQPWGYAGGNMPFGVALPNTGPQPGVQVTVLTGATTTLLPVPVNGFQYRIRYISLSAAVAPAAVTSAFLRTINAGVPLARHQFAAAPGELSTPCDLWVPDQNVGNANVSDGVSGTNNTSVSVLMQLAYELWPTNLFPV